MKRTSPVYSRISRPLNKRKIIFLVAFSGVIICAIWWARDILLFREASFPSYASVSFENMNKSQVVSHVEKNTNRYFDTTDSTAQIVSLIHILEGNRYLVLSGEMSFSSFYDVFRMVLFPQQRNKLKSKEQYTHEIGRYFRRQRKLRLKITGYAFSAPVFYNRLNSSRAEVYLIRYGSLGKEHTVYRFKNLQGKRYYVTFPFFNAGIKFNLTDNR